MTTMKGYDLSHYQAGLDVTKTDAQFVICKATEGTNFVDSHCNTFISQAKKKGIPYGVYHFYRGNPTAEADFFLKNIAGYVGNALLALDFEDANYRTDVAGAKKFLDRVYAKTGIKPVIYFNKDYLTEPKNNWAPVANADYGFWYARPGVSSPGSVSPWKNIVLWQYSWEHAAGGYKVDGDVFYGDKTTWKAYATGDAHDDDEDTQPTPSPDTGGDEDMPREASTGYTGDHDLPADGEWRTLTIGQTDAGKNVYALVDGPALATGTLSVVVRTAKPGTEVDVRTVHVDTKSGESKVVYGGFPLEQFTQGGDTQIVLPFTERIHAAAEKGAVRRLRFEIKAYGGGKFTVKDARARSLYWPS